MLNSLNTTFSENPVSLDIARSTFTAHPKHITTMTEGDLVPVFFSEVLPGDTFSVDTSFLARMATPIFPVADNAFIDFFYFYVPNRIVWNHWKEFLGENTSAPWTQSVEYTIPQLKFDRQWSSFEGYNQGSHNSGYGPLPESVVDYFGITTGIVPSYWVDSDSVNHYCDELTVSDLPNRAYRLIWNEFFRDQNVDTPVPVYLDDSDRSYYDSRATFSGQTDVGEFYNYGGKPLKVNKFHDYFTSCLPAPQKGPSVSVGVVGGSLPVVPGSNNHLSASSYPVYLKESSGPSSAGVYTWTDLAGKRNLGGLSSDSVFGGINTTGFDSPYFIAPSNLIADANNLVFASVSTLREAFAVQRLFEIDARAGTRYREQLKAIFGVTAPDARVQVPEYLGGCRVPINMDQVLQTSSTDVVSPQGNTAGYSLTTNVDNSFTKSFVEHGMVIGLAAIRVQHTYSQGIMPYWFRKRRFDFYYPQLANISEQPVLMRNICATGSKELDEQVFGYQEAWADYRFMPNRMSGAFSPVSYYDSDAGSVEYSMSQLANAWTYADFYSYQFTGAAFDEDSRAFLSSSWMKEDKSNIGQTLALPSDSQFIVDMQFDVTMTRPMPVRSIPGLIDHH